MSAPEALAAEAAESRPDPLLEFVAERDVPCPSCGYSLRGLRSTICPECQQPLELRVGLTEPRLGLWIAAVIGAACGFGFNAMLIGFYVISVMGSRRSTGDKEFLVLVGPGMAIFGITLAALVVMGRAFRRASLEVRTLIAILTWLAIGADLVIFSKNLR